MMIQKRYKLMITAVVTGMLLAMCVVTPLSAQYTQAANQGASAQPSPCLTSGQGSAPNGNQGSNSNAHQPSSVGTGPDNAGPPLDCWLALNAHQWHWYKFRYGYNGRTDKPAHQATVELTMDMASCMSFELWTPERLRAAKDDPSLGPVGTGSPKFTPADPKSSSSKNRIPTILIWSGSQNGSSTFYVIIKNRSNVTCTYHLSISGASVFYPTKSK